VELGATNRESGLYVVDHPDSKHTPKAIDDQEAWFFKAGWNYAYFFIDPTFKWALGSNVLVQVEYRVVRGKPIGLHYDGTHNAYASAEESASKQPMGQWQILEFRLRDARFGNSQNGGADLRIWDNENGFYLRRVTVVRYERKPPPPRDPSTSSNLIDLTSFYRWSLRSYLPGGDIDKAPEVLQTVRRKTGVNFDLRGCLSLYGRGARENETAPVVVTGIPIGRHVSRLHFLHSASHKVTHGTKIGEYIMHMSDGSRHELAIVYGVNVRALRGDPGTTPEAELAWEGEGIKRGGHSTVRIFKIAWVNPRPDLAVKSLDSVSTKTGSSPELLAITAE
jgi:hypothetical protein